MNVTRARWWFQRSCMFTPTWGKDSTLQLAGKKTPSRGFFEKIILNKATLFLLPRISLNITRGLLNTAFKKDTVSPVIDPFCKAFYVVALSAWKLVEDWSTPPVR